MIKEIKRIIKESEIMKEDDAKWPQKNKDGRQELEIRMGNEHISFETAKIGSLVDVQESSDPEGLRVFYYLVQDLKALVFSLIALHFKVGKPDCVGRESGLTSMHRNIDQAHINNYNTQPPTSYITIFTANEEISRRIRVASLILQSAAVYDEAMEGMMNKRHLSIMILPCSARYPRFFV